jgi:hypothetical protein
MIARAWFQPSTDLSQHSDDEPTCWATGNLLGIRGLVGMEIPQRLPVQRGRGSAVHSIDRVTQPASNNKTSDFTNKIQVERIGDKLAKWNTHLYQE